MTSWLSGTAVGGGLGWWGYGLMYSGPRLQGMHTRVLGGTGQIPRSGEMLEVGGIARIGKSRCSIVILTGFKSFQ